MDNNNWRPNQGTEANMDTSDWRGGLPHESRQRIVNKMSKDPWRAESLEGEITLGLRFTKFNHGIVDPSIPAKRSMAKITLYFSFDEMFPAIRDLNPIQKSLNRVPLDLSFFTTAKASPRATSAAFSLCYTAFGSISATVHLFVPLLPSSGRNIGYSNPSYEFSPPPNPRMDTLKRHLPVSVQEGLHELQKIAQRFEEKIFTAATSQSDYLRKISLKMLTMETKSQGSMAPNLPPNQGGPSNKPPDPGLGIPPQVHNPGQQHPIPMSNQTPNRQQLLPQNIQNSIASQPSNIAQAPIQNVGQNNPNVQNIPGQNSVGSTIGQNANMQNMFPGSQRQIQGRQQVVPQQQQQQSQNSQQYIYQQQMQQQLIRQKLQQQQQQQQQQQNLLQSNQLQSSQQPSIQTSTVMQQPSMMQTSLPSIQHNQQSNNQQQSTQSVLQQHSQVIRQQQPQQTSIIHQQQTPMTQQSILPPQQQQQQQQQLMGAQANAPNMHHTQILGSQNNVGDLQQPQRLLTQQNNLSNLQQQQLINQQNNLSNMHQQLGNNVPGLQPQQVLGPQPGNSGMQTSQHSAHVLQQSQVPIQQQSQQNASNLLPSQVQQSQPQAPQQQLMPQIQSQPAQLQQQLGLQQQPNPLQRDMQQRLQASGPLLQQSNVLDQQKQLYQSQRPLPETSSKYKNISLKFSLKSELYYGIRAGFEPWIYSLPSVHNNSSPPSRLTPIHAEPVSAFPLAASVIFSHTISEKWM
ncbi:Mediator of RNA polymerase II transcription subunit 15a [Glycine soja]|uniref:Mediator of RNA polymerase II transcription subunit 15a n=1 Tax=Glycine soja TaxID=3848 RepID=A0A445GM11_GLYSO|nr:Mediator of RNA polymerase II transcription subunit 15a [Glycine soja]